VFIGGNVGGSVGAPVNSPKLAKMKADNAKAWLIIAGTIASALALSEGIRYDGWINLHPLHPVHLYGVHGEYRWMPLAELDPETVAWTAKALVRPDEGPWTTLGRAPLNRQGLSYSFTLGAAEIPSAAEKAQGSSDVAKPAFIGHIALGYFPSQVLGVLLDFGLGYRQNDFDDTVFESRNALELQFFPVAANPIHVGFYGDVGISARFEDGADGEDKRSFLLGGGALMQFELTTRLTLTARAGVNYSFGEPTTDATIGVSVY